MSDRAFAVISGYLNPGGNPFSQPSGPSSLAVTASYVVMSSANVPVQVGGNYFLTVTVPLNYGSTVESVRDDFVNAIRSAIGDWTVPVTWLDLL